MSLLRNLTGITTPASTDLFYVVQNNTDYKMTSEQFMNFAKSAIVVSLTQAQYDALTPAEKSNGSIYLINDATLSASDIAYGQGTVEDSLDNITPVISTQTVDGVAWTIIKTGRIYEFYAQVIIPAGTQGLGWGNLYVYMTNQKTLPIALTNKFIDVSYTDDGVSTLAGSYSRVLNRNTTTAIEAIRPITTTSAITVNKYIRGYV